jgi:hypothetical protein
MNWNRTIPDHHIPTTKYNLTRVLQSHFPILLSPGFQPGDNRKSNQTSKQTTCFYQAYLACLFYQAYLALPVSDLGVALGYPWYHRDFQRYLDLLMNSRGQIYPLAKRQEQVLQMGVEPLSVEYLVMGFLRQALREQDL